MKKIIILFSIVIGSSLSLKAQFYSLTKDYLFFYPNRSFADSRNWAIITNGTSEGHFQIATGDANSSGMPDVNGTPGLAKFTIKNNGFAGIGTAGPVSLLTLNKSGAGAQTSELTVQSNATNVARFGWNAAGYVDISSLYNNNHIVLTPTGIGNVGIGTPSPTSLLTLNRNGSGAQPSEISIQSNNTNVARFGWSDAGYVDIRAMYSNNHIVLSPSGTGNVGIGTVTPYFKLQTLSSLPGVAAFNTTSTGNTGNISILNGSSYNYGVLGVISGNGTANGDVYGLGYSSNANSSFTSVLNWTCTGNVGIGTTSPIAPEAKLTLQNSATGLNSGILIKDGSSNPRGAIYYSGGQELVIDALSGPGGPDMSTFKIRSGGADRLFITRDGNMGLGTSLTSNTNSYKLAVNGKIGAKEVQVENTSSTWADYVFEQDYKLMPISDVEEYIRNNKHLPEIPSKEDVEKNGHRLGEMDVLLLKKVEELTLYIIELEKRIQTIEKK